jgi:hypothetical protein
MYYRITFLNYAGMLKGKGKDVPVLDDIWGSGGIAPPFLTSALEWDKWSVSRPCRFTPGTHWIGGWWAPELVWTMWRRKQSCTAGNRTWAVQPVASLYWAILPPLRRYVRHEKLQQMVSVFFECLSGSQRCLANGSFKNFNVSQTS